MVDHDLVHTLNLDIEDTLDDEFINSDEESKAYRLYNLVSKKLIISRDVTFDEEGL